MLDHCTNGLSFFFGPGEAIGAPPLATRSRALEGATCFKATCMTTSTKALGADRTSILAKLHQGRLGPKVINEL